MIIFRLKNTAQRKILSDYLQRELENDSQILYKLGLSHLLFDCTHYWLVLDKKGQVKTTLLPSPHKVLPERLCSVTKCRFKTMWIFSFPVPVWASLPPYVEMYGNPRPPKSSNSFHESIVSFFRQELYPVVFRHINSFFLPSSMSKLIKPLKTKSKQNKNLDYLYSCSASFRSKSFFLSTFFWCNYQ